MNKKEYAKEVGMVSSIMADFISEKLYKKMQNMGTGYIATHEQISDWAMEFVDNHMKTKWEEVLDNTIEPMSKEWKKRSIICWDDCIADWAEYKLENI